MVRHEPDDGGHARRSPAPGDVRRPMRVAGARATSPPRANSQARAWVLKKAAPASRRQGQAHHERQQADGRDGTQRTAADGAPAGQRTDPDREQQHDGPDQVELLLEAQRPVVLDQAPAPPDSVK